MVYMADSGTITAARPVVTAEMWDALHTRLSKETTLQSDRIASRAMQRQYEAGLASVQLNPEGSEIVACAFLWENTGWLELGTIWVAQECRGQRMASRVSEMSMAIARERGKRVMLMTSDDKIEKLTLRLGFTKVDGSAAWENVVPMEASCGYCTFETCPVRRQLCALKATPKCRLYYWKPG